MRHLGGIAVSMDLREFDNNAVSLKMRGTTKVSNLEDASYIQFYRTLLAKYIIPVPKAL